MNLKIFSFFYVLAFFWAFRDDESVGFALLIAIPLSPLFAMVALILYQVQTKIWEILGKGLHKDKWDSTGYDTY